MYFLFAITDSAFQQYVFCILQNVFTLDAIKSLCHVLHGFSQSVKLALSKFLISLNIIAVVCFLAMRVSIDNKLFMLSQIDL